jgi:hypothetical protein
MPMTFNPVPDSGLVGPGLMFQVGTNSLTAQTNWTWRVNFSSDSDGVNVIGTAIGHWQQNGQFAIWGTHESPFFTWSDTGQAGVAEGATVHIQQQLSDPTFAIQDSGTATAPYSGTAGIGHLIRELAGQGGLTTDEAALLTHIGDTTDSTLAGIGASITSAAGTTVQTLGQLFSGKTHDTITEGDLGTACFPSKITSTIPIGGSAYGLQIQVTSFADWYAFTGPAEDFAQQVLYTLHISRGGNLLVREGVHTLSKLVYPLPGIPEFPVVLVSLPIDPGDYTIDIIPNTGVCVAAQLLGFP